MRQRSFLFSCLTVTTVLSAPGSSSLLGQDIEYPPARRETVVDAYHGIDLEDPYRWLENMNSEATLTWARAQDELTREFVTDVPVRDALEERILRLWETGRVGIMAKAGNRYYYSRTDPGADMPVIYAQNGFDAEPAVFFRTSSKFDLEDRTFRWFQPSPTGKHIVFHEGQGQSRWRHLLIMDTDSQRFLPDRIKGYYSGRGGVAWSADGRGFYYTRYEEPEADRLMETTVANSRIFFHVLGTHQSEDRLIFEIPEEPSYLFWPRVTLDGRFLIITEASAPETRIFVKNLGERDGQIRGLLTEADAAYWFEANVGSRFILRTTKDAPNSRLIQVDLSHSSPAGRVEIVAEDSEADLQAVSQIGDRLVLRYVRDARPVVRVHELDGTFSYDVDLPSIGLIGGFPDDKDPETFYRFNNVFDPGSVYRFNVETGRSELVARPDIVFDPDDFEMKQVFYRSKDGTRIPMFLAHRKELAKDTVNPVFMYAYGAFKWSAFPWYQPHVLAWMELGGIYAMPGIRGGGEYGEDWYQAGIREKKQNGIDDYLAAAEFLIREGYTSSERIVANGGSASGLLAGAALVQRPELFGAALIDVPTLDMLRYQHFGSARNWASEFGISENESQFRALLDYSPYHNLKPGTCYPAAVTTVGELDDTTAPMHGYKFTAALQHVQACDNPVMLKVLWGAGHAWNYGNTNEQRADNAADLLSFLVKVLRLDGKGALALPSSGP